MSGHISFSSFEAAITGARSVATGAFGIIWKATLGEKRDVVAIKDIPLNDNALLELDILGSLCHANVVVFLSSFIAKLTVAGEHLYLVMEFMPETVRSLLDERKRYLRSAAQSFAQKVALTDDKMGLPAASVSRYGYQLFRALAYIHSVGVCHRDIKPKNLLVRPDRALLKVCDFGSAVRLVDGEAKAAYLGSLLYRSPEELLASGKKAVFTHNVDMWSAGIVLSEMAIGCRLFRGWNCEDQIKEIASVLGPAPRLGNDHQNKNSRKAVTFKVSLKMTDVFKDTSAPKAVVDLVSKILVYCPAQRLTPLQACAHSFFSVPMPAFMDDYVMEV